MFCNNINSQYFDQEKILKKKIREIHNILKSLPKGTDQIVYDELNGNLDSMKTCLKDLHNSIEYQLEKSFAYSQMTSAFEETIKFFNSCKCCDRHQCNKPSCLDSEIKFQLNECNLCYNEFPNHKSFCCHNNKCKKFFCKECLDKYNTMSKTPKQCPYCQVSFIDNHSKTFTTSYESWCRLKESTCRCGCRKYARKIVKLWKKVSEKKNLSVVDCHDNIDFINGLLNQYYCCDIPTGIFHYISYEKFLLYQKKRFDSLPSDTIITIGQMKKYELIINHKIYSKPNWYNVCKKNMVEIIRKNPYMTLSDYIENIEIFFKPFLAF